MINHERIDLVCNTERDDLDDWKHITSQLNVLRDRLEEDVVDA